MIANLPVEVGFSVYAARKTRGDKLVGMRSILVATSGRQGEWPAITSPWIEERRRLLIFAGLQSLEITTDGGARIEVKIKTSGHELSSSLRDAKNAVDKMGIVGGVWGALLEKLEVFSKLVEGVSEARFLNMSVMMYTEFCHFR